METIHGLNTNGDAIVATGVVFTVLAVAAVGLRFVSKRMTSAALGVDDWLLLAALVIYFVAEVLVIQSDVVGRKALSPDDDRYITYLQYVYIYSVFYFPVAILVQISLLLFIRHLFYPSHLRYTCLVLIAVCAAYLTISLIIEIGYPGHTIDYFFPGSSTTIFNVTYLPFWLAMALIETLIDIAIFVLPLRELQRLKLSMHKKLLLSFVFSLGGFVIITSIIRIAILYRTGTADFDLTKGDIWLNVHLGTAIISACLPTYRPLVSRISQIVRSRSFHISQDTYHSDDTHTLTAEKKKTRGLRFRQLGEDISMDQRFAHQGSFVNARRSERNDTTRLEWDEPVRAGEAIGVKQTIHVV